MKKKRILSWILSMALVLSVFNIPLAGVYAAGEESATASLKIYGTDAVDIYANEDGWGTAYPYIEAEYTVTSGEETETIWVSQDELDAGATIEWSVEDSSTVNAAFYDVYEDEYNAETSNEAYPDLRIGGSDVKAGNVVITAVYDPDGEEGELAAVEVTKTIKVTVYNDVAATVVLGNVVYNIYKSYIEKWDPAKEEYVPTVENYAQVVGTTPGWTGAIPESVSSGGATYPVTQISDFTIRNYGISGKPFDDEKLWEADDPNRFYDEKYWYTQDASDKWYYTNPDQVTSVKTISIPKAAENVYVGFADIKGLTAINVAAGHKKYYSVDGVLYEKYDKDDWYEPNKWDDNGDAIGYDETKLDPDGDGVVPVKDAYGKYVTTKNKDGKLEKTYKKIDAMLVCYPMAKTAKKFVIPEGVQLMSSGAFYSYYDKESLETIVLPASFDIAQYSSYERDTKTTYVDEIFNQDYFQTWEKNKFQSWNIRVFTKGDANAVNALKIHAAGYADPNTGVKALPIGQYMNKAKVKAGKLNVTVSTKDNGDLALVSIAKNNKKTVTVPAKITINGIKYNVTDINAKAFKNCKKATKIVIPASVTLIKKNAFNGAKKLKTVQFKTKKSNIVFKKGAFKGVKKSAVAKVPKKMKKAQMTKFQKAIKKGGFKGTVKK